MVDQHFVSYFNQRYNALKSMLMGRQDIQNLTSISRIKGKKDRDQDSHNN